MNFLLSEITLAVSLLTQAQVTIPEDELICMTRNIYHEARNQDVDGQIAVGYVVVNRVSKAGFPDTMCGVIYQRSQFSWTSSIPDSYEPKNEVAYQLAMLLSIQVIMGNATDVTNGATFYYAPNTVTPKWSYVFAETAVIGDHRFMTD